MSRLAPAAIVRGSFVAAVGVVALLTASSAVAAAPINPVATVNVRDLAAQARTVPYRPVLRNSPAQVQWRAREAAKHEGAPSALRAPELKPPNVPGVSPVSDESPDAFEGLDIKDTVFTNGFELEPPDQGLCGGTFDGTTYLFESINLALALYDTDTNQYTPALDLNRFFGQAPAFDPATGLSGPFLSDPKCYFDPDTGHWFHTVLKIDVDPVTGAFGTTSATLVAASVGADPLGPYNIYSIDGTDAGGAGCPVLRRPAAPRRGRQRAVRLDGGVQHRGDGVQRRADLCDGQARAGGRWAVERRAPGDRHDPDRNGPAGDGAEWPL